MVYGYDTDIAPSVGSNHTRIRSIAYDFLDVLSNERQNDAVDACQCYRYRS